MVGYYFFLEYSDLLGNVLNKTKLIIKGVLFEDIYNLDFCFRWSF